MKIANSLFCFLFVGLMSVVVQGADLVTPVDYYHLDNQTTAVSAFKTKDFIVVFGPRRYLKFDKKFETARYSGPLEFDGYAQFVRLNHDQQLIIAGHNHKRPNSIVDLFSMDTDGRQNVLGRVHQDLYPSSLQKFRELDDRLSYGLEINASNQPVLLAGGGNNLTLSVFEPSLDRILKSISVNATGPAALAIANDGNYLVTGFETFEDIKIIPTLWEFDLNLKQLAKQRLDEPTERKNLSFSTIDLLTYRDEVYVAYGWDTSGQKEEKSNEVQVQKIRGSSAQWKHEPNLPFHHRMRFFISPSGVPYVLYPRMDNIHKVSFDPANGHMTMTLLNKPTKPVNCFPPNWTYEIVNVLLTEDGKENIVISSNPLNHPEAGCVAIGLIN